ncbi:MAG: hypothetical protein AAF039_04330, partial [Bacteroidota bacterium]
VYFDYQKLKGFTQKIEHYGISHEYFETLFWRGLSKAYHFHQSSNYIKRSNVNHYIEKELLQSPYLKHPLKKPEKNTSKSDKSLAVLNSFSGEWHGKWQSMHVEHLWLPIRKCTIKTGLEYEIIGFQTCFTGDGFGWNYLVRKDGKIIILGHVYHFNKKGTLDYENPHYAFLNDQSQLTWVSDNHVYYEFVCNDSHCDFDSHYVITAIPYSNKNTLKFGTPIQAIYTAKNNTNEF